MPSENSVCLKSTEQPALTERAACGYNAVPGLSTGTEDNLQINIAGSVLLLYGEVFFCLKLIFLLFPFYLVHLMRGGI